MRVAAVALGVLALAVGGAAMAATRKTGGAVRLGEVDTWANQIETENGASRVNNISTPNLDANIPAMLEAIAHAEGTATRGEPYRVCFGYRFTVQSFAEHPAVLGAWGGETLSDAMCAAAGHGPGCVSTAAGKYQITRPTWIRIKAKLGLPDFSPASQDAAATELLRERGALLPLGRGLFAQAVQAARKEWASLPGAGYGQTERSQEWLTAKFEQAGGIVA